MCGVNFHRRQKISSANDSVIPLDTKKFWSEGADTFLERLPANDERIDQSVAPDCLGDGLVCRRIGHAENNQQIDIGLALNEISADNAAIETTGQEILSEQPTQSLHGLVNKLFERGGHRFYFM